MQWEDIQVHTMNEPTTCRSDNLEIFWEGQGQSRSVIRAHNEDMLTEERAHQKEQLAISRFSPCGIRTGLNRSHLVRRSMYGQETTKEKGLTGYECNTSRWMQCNSEI